MILGEGMLHFLAGEEEGGENVSLMGGWKIRLFMNQNCSPPIFSFYKVTKEVISEREKEKRMCVVAGGERQSVQKDFREGGKGRSCLERVEFLDIIDALVEVCYHQTLKCVFPSPLVGPINQNLYKIQNIV